MITYITAVGALTIMIVVGSLSAAGWIEAYMWNRFRLGQEDPKPYFSEVLVFAVLTTAFLFLSYFVGLWVL